jgi:hypothetical protein
VDKLTDGAEIIAGCFRIRPEQRGPMKFCVFAITEQPARSPVLAGIALTRVLSGKLGQCRIGADNELLELVDKNKDCPFE